ncbi:response regulator transcription factor [Spirosoma montaniterrae]|uniref:LuxR family transcriptional regulator n=1 Tax=Spirosoma montaniterrae TaxID=1178516 RepID=A0A1P9WT82_9BACT|nr:response regulator transcription factor [Spirosoma montaniterrae]AQG78550.1 hypothetical protein AWR27_03855 [Spirosoma montaniterrae]
MTNILILDDHPIVVSGLALYLQNKDDLTVVGKVHSPHDAIQFLRTQPVDVLVSDMHLDSDLTGTDVLVRIKQAHPSIKVVFYTMIEKNNDVREAILAGAEGYVLKKYDADEVYRAIRTVRHNKQYYSPELVHILVRASSGADARDEEPQALRNLTNREREVMVLIARDVPNGEIAQKLSVSESTINSHRANLMQKLDVRSNVGIAHFAFKYGLIDSTIN